MKIALQRLLVAAAIALLPLSAVAEKNELFAYMVLFHEAGKKPFDSTRNLAAPEFAAANVKGAVHEFGHALGLPHIGPRPGLKRGNSLMGPVNRAYWNRTKSDETRVHLSEVSVAMLSAHPIFQPKQGSPLTLPGKLEVTDLEATEANGHIIVSGRIVSDQRPHTAVLLDSERGRFGDYWAGPTRHRLTRKRADSASRSKSRFNQAPRIWPSVSTTE